MSDWAFPTLRKLHEHLLRQADHYENVARRHELAGDWLLASTARRQHEAYRLAATRVELQGYRDFNQGVQNFCSSVTANASKGEQS